MKHKFLAILIVLLILASVLPVAGYAYGGYYVLKGEKHYHFVSCPEIMGYRIEDLKFYETKERVESIGYKPSVCCYEDTIDYESDGATIWFSSDAKLQNALELERLYGIFEGYEAGKEEGHATGYTEGLEEGISQGTAKGKEEATKNNYLLIGLSCLFAFVGFYFGKKTKQSALEQELNSVQVEYYKLQGKLSNYENN